MKFEFRETELSGVLVVEHGMINDERGFFSESFRYDDLIERIPPLVQENISFSYKGVLRGLHFQKSPQQIGKLIKCVYGRILDVVVDITPSSPTLGKWLSFELNSDKPKMIWVPKGYAHGFYTQSCEACVMYKTTGYYSPECDAGILWNDPDLNIGWGIEELIISHKDKNLPRLRDLKL